MKETVRYDTWNVHEGCIETHHREPTRDGQDQERRALQKAYIEHGSKNSTYALWTNVATSAFLLGDIRRSRQTRDGHVIANGRLLHRSFLNLSTLNVRKVIRNLNFFFFYIFHRVSMLHYSNIRIFYYSWKRNCFPEFKIFILPLASYLRVWNIYLLHIFRLLIVSYSFLPEICNAATCLGILHKRYHPCRTVSGDPC